MIFPSMMQIINVSQLLNDKITSVFKTKKNLADEMSMVCHIRVKSIYDRLFGVTNDLYSLLEAEKYNYEIKPKHIYFLTQVYSTLGLAEDDKIVTQSKQLCRHFIYPINDFLNLSFTNEEFSENYFSHEAVDYEFGKIRSHRPSLNSTLLGKEKDLKDGKKELGDILQWEFKTRFGGIVKGVQRFCEGKDKCATYIFTRFNRLPSDVEINRGESFKLLSDIFEFLGFDEDHKILQLARIVNSEYK